MSGYQCQIGLLHKGIEKRIPIGDMFNCLQRNSQTPKRTYSKQNEIHELGIDLKLALLKNQMGLQFS